MSTAFKKKEAIIVLKKNMGKKLQICWPSGQGPDLRMNLLSSKVLV